jgi:L-arabinokinase
VTFRPAGPLLGCTSDLERFAVDVSARLNAGAWAADADVDSPAWVARAPGRLDVMGGIADYSGALVLQWPIREATRVAVRPWSNPSIAIVSVRQGEADRHADVPLDLVADPHRSYDEVRAWFAADPSRRWAAYIAGVFHVLAREMGVRFTNGAAILVESDVPEGKGVSSSAAIESATMEAVTHAWNVSIDPRDRAVRCQQVENLVVGAPCGVMDQMTSTCGEADRLMALLCQPAELQGSVSLPDGLALWGVDSGIRHAVTGADYGAVRVGAFMGYRILADLAGLRVTPGERKGHVRIDDPRWHGYLANVGVDAFREFASSIPEAIDGGAFLARYGGMTDLVTRIDPSRRYAVRTPAAHPAYEHARVSEWAHALRHDPGTADPTRLGALMYESHASYSACGLGSDGTDRLVALARDAGAARGILGAKITGGGSGGTVAILGTAKAGDAVRAIAAEYAAETGRDAYIFEGSSPGAAHTGAIRIDRT